MTGSLEEKPIAGELSRAVERNDIGAVEELLRRGADINEKHAYGMTPLMAAAYRNQETTLQLLVASGADVNARNNEGWTALVYAIVGDSIAGVRLLIENGADAHLHADNGQTAQVIAENLKKQEIALLLKEHMGRHHVVALQKQERLKKISVKPSIVRRAQP